MAGYANRTIMLAFPELTEDGDEPVHVVVRNPRMMPLADLTPPDLPQRDGESEDMRDYRAGCVVMSRLVVAWHVYDATDLGEDQAPLPLPATPDLVERLPFQIQEAIGGVITQVRPEA